MSQEDLIRRHQAEWQRLENLLGRIQRDATGFSEDEVREFGQLYRLATSDLALAQRDYPGERLTVYLNRLVARAHGAVYRSEPMRWAQLRRFYAWGFPALYRSLLPYTGLAFLFFSVPAVVAFCAVLAYPSAIHVLLGDQADRLVPIVESGKLWTEIAPDVRSAASAAILTNNIQVMFLTFAGSITGALLTAWAILSNGLNFGAVFGLLQAHGMTGGLAEFVSAHGFIELSVLFLAGGCGFYVGDGLLRPGLLRRRDALVVRGRSAVAAILGCVPLLVLAGLIEGFISPSSLPWWLKLAVGLGTGTALYAYWLLPRRIVAPQR